MSGGQSTDFQSRLFENNGMDKDEAHPVECKLVSYVALELDKMAKNDKGYYISLVILPENMLMIVDNKACNLRLYRHDGTLLAKSDKLQSQPWDVCLINATEVAVILFDGQIEIMSFDTTTITRQQTLYTSGFDKCHAVKILGSLGTCVVSGRKQDNISWGIVSLDNGHVKTVHKICEGKFGVSYLATSPYNTCTMVYVSCDAGPFSRDTGLYGFDINTGTKEFLYQHKELENPRGVSVDTRDSVYVCNWGRPSCIHQLNELGDPVTIHREGMPLRLLAMYFEKQQEELFVTSFESNVVSRYKPKYTDHQGLPPEIRKMDMKSQQLFQDALKAGKQKVYNIRLMVVGHHGVGKTTLTKRILGEEITEESPHVPTQGIEVHSECCRIDHDTKKWNVNEIGHFSNTDQLLVDIVHEHVEKSSGGVKSDVSVVNSDVSDVKLDVLEHNLETQTDIKIANDSDEHRSGLIEVQNTSPSTHVIEKSLAQSDFDRFVMRNKSLTYSGKPVSYVTILDFAGQFLFYTTHQAFMSWRTLYLLVTDISMSMDDTVRGDMCHMDLNGCKECSIQEYAIYWLNSIYSHVQQQTGSIGQSMEKEPNHPPVILVATHMDKLPEEMKKRIKEDYFSHVTRILMGRPLIHLVKGMFAISNIGQDADIDELKKKIFELAQKQGYWGEEIPATWLVLQQKLMELKRAGEPIVEYADVEKLNKSSDVKIASPEELEVFLRFQHDLGNIVFYSTEKLRNMVVLDPSWLIDGVKVMMSRSEHLMLPQTELLPQWFDFKNTGRLTESLIDWLWSEDQHEKYRHNKEHLLKVMEMLSIIAKPIEKEDDVQNLEKYYWVPCMIHKRAPDYVKNGEHHKDATKTSNLCFVSNTKFIHVGVFHRLIASCLSKWRAAKEGEEYLLYSGCCEFEVDNCHTLLLSLMDFVILATIFRYSRKGFNPNKNLCISVKEFIHSTLSEIAECICPNLGFDIQVKCEKSSIHTTEGLLEMSGNEEVRCDCIQPAHGVNVDDLIQFWEEKMDLAEEICLCKSDITMPEEYQKSLQKRVLPPGKIYHAFFSYASPDIHWVKKTVEKLEKDHGFVCCEYDRDNTPGKPLLKFAEDSIRNAYKTVVVMTREAFQSGFVELEIQMAINQGFIEKRNCIVPVLVEDCKIPGYLRVLNYVDARDTKKRSIWWPKLLMELESQDMDQVVDIKLITIMKENTFREIGEIFQDRRYPTKNTMTYAVKECGYNKGVKCLLRGMSNLIRKKNPHASRVWCGYRLPNPYTPTFVACLRKHTRVPEMSSLPKTFHNFEIVYRYEHKPSNEETFISELLEGNKCTVPEDAECVLHCIARHAGRLMQEHSNLGIIAASCVKATGFNGSYSSLKLLEKLCIVFYVPVKGIIPIGEKEFPSDIEGIVTDVREGEFVFHVGNRAGDKLPKLRMGCCISTKDKISGTLGGFIDLPGDKIGCITAAHVILGERERKKYHKSKSKTKRKYDLQLKNGEKMIEIYQPSPTNPDAFGKVSQIVFDEGNESTPSVDVAVIEITDDSRRPDAGIFPLDISPDIADIGLTEKQPMVYTSGKIRELLSPSDSGCVVLKYGSSSGITYGQLVWNGACVRTVNIPGKSWDSVDETSDPRFFNQWVVKDMGKRKMSKPGDSGALVFICNSGNIRDLETIGLLVGGTTNQRKGRMYIVTPIKPVFEKLGLSSRSFKSFPDTVSAEEIIYSRQIVSSEINLFKESQKK